MVARSVRPSHDARPARHRHLRPLACRRRPRARSARGAPCGSGRPRAGGVPRAAPARARARRRTHDTRVAVRDGMADREQPSSRASTRGRSPRARPRVRAGSDRRSAMRARRDRRDVHPFPRRAADRHARVVRAHRDRGRDGARGRPDDRCEPRHGLREAAAHASALGREARDARRGPVAPVARARLAMRDAARPRCGRRAP